MEVCRELSVPYAVVSQSAPPWTWPSDDDIERLKTVYPGARKAFFVSRENLLLTERQLGCKLPNATVVRNPFRVPYDVDLAWNNERVAKWACVARLDAYIKGHDLLFETVAKDKWRRRSVRVTLYGKGTNEKSLRSMREHMNLRNVAFAGFVSSPLEIWKNEQCLVMPSRAEGLPLAIVEAMLCARPCVVTNVSGNPELLEDNVTGFIAENATVRALDEAMERAWQNRDAWETMGRRAAEAVREMVPADPVGSFVDQLLSLL